MKKVVIEIILFVIINTINNNVLAQWVKTNAPDSTVTDIISNDTCLFANIDFKVYCSTDDGINWHQINTGLTAPVLTIAVRDTNLFAGTHDNGIYISTNLGTSWSEINDNLGRDPYVDVIFTNDSSIFIIVSSYFSGGPGGLFISKNNGSSWEEIGSGFTTSLTVVNNIIFVSIPKDGAFRSADGGSTWEYMSDLGHNSGISDFAVIGKNIFAGLFSAGLYLSRDYGITWTSVDYGLGDYNNIRSFAVSGQNLFVISNQHFNENLLFLSTDYGKNWGLVEPKLFGIKSIAIFDSFILIGTGKGIWRRPLSEVITDIDNKKNILPTSFQLFQNYPNPFNPTTTINYSLPRSSFVILKIYDVLGREIATIVNKEELPGNYEINFDANDLTSGVYFYQLRADEFTLTKKMVLLR